MLNRLLHWMCFVGQSPMREFFITFIERDRGNSVCSFLTFFLNSSYL
uniref:Uncharacterized protein n=1 Tax=Ascaris lumbricoides TaxID=6252 RepID=A0A0M3IPK0_ASCLU